MSCYNAPGRCFICSFVVCSRANLNLYRLYKNRTNSPFLDINKSRQLLGWKNSACIYFGRRRRLYSAEIIFCTILARFRHLSPPKCLQLSCYRFDSVYSVCYMIEITALVVKILLELLNLYENVWAQHRLAVHFSHPFVVKKF